MLVKQKRQESLLELGFEDLKGKITLNKSFKNGVPITSLSINLKNVFLEDVDFIISELSKHKEILGLEFNKSIEYLRS
ncbi:hypothetical protein [Flavobacterium sp. WC2430]|uniref:hypothetical protein n=1 Tax=Flavobacterium sp. WC2430 TaxID=3234137 RepID=UPI00346596D2